MFDTIFEQSNIGMFTGELDGRLLRVNDAFCRMVGREASDIVGRNSDHITHPDDLAVMSRSLEGLRSREGASNLVEKRYVRPDGSVVWARVILGIVSADGKANGVVGMVQDITEERQTREELRISETRFHELADAMPQIVFAATPDGDVDYFNQRWYDYTGLPPDQVGYESWKHTFSEKVLPGVAEAWANAVVQGETFELEYPLRRYDGNFRWHLSRALPVKNAQGKVIRWYGSVTDINRLKLAEQNLRQSETRFRLLSQLSEDTRDLTDPTEISQTVGRLLGRHLELDHCVYAEVGPDADTYRIEHDCVEDQPAITGSYQLGNMGATIAEAVRAGTTILIPDVEHDLPEGGSLEAFDNLGVRAAVICPLVRGDRLVALLMAFQRQPRTWAPQETELIGAVLDRTWATVAHSRGVQAMVDSQRRLSDVVRGSLDCIIGMDHLGIVTEWNPAAVTTFGYSRGEAVGRELSTLIIPPSLRERHREGLARYMVTRTGPVIGQRVELPAIRKDGSEVSVELTVTPITNAEPPEFNGVVRDISDRKRAEAEREALLQSEREARAESEVASRMKDEFLATLSHELRTPLHAILGWSRILGRRQDLPGDLAEGLTSIERSAKAQAQIIDDLLDMSRIISGKVRLSIAPVDLTQVIKDAVDTVRPTAQARGVQLVNEAGADDQPIRADANRLKQVFWNLLSNAVKFTPRGGRVRITVETTDEAVTIRITDTGQGIDPRFLPHVFDRFRQADASTTRTHGGLGLGLSIVKQLTELHGGTVTADSAGPGEGTTFTVQLPQHSDPLCTDGDTPTAKPAGEATARTGGGPNLSGIEVLLVDDEADARAMIRRLLEQQGARVTTATSAAEAFEQVNQSRFDLMISDIGMPDEDGLSLIRRVRQLPEEENGRIPAVALTAYAQSRDRVEAMVAGFQVHVAKPVDTDELLLLIARLTGRA